MIRVALGRMRRRRRGGGVVALVGMMTVSEALPVSCTAVECTGGVTVRVGAAGKLVAIVLIEIHTGTWLVRGLRLVGSVRLVGSLGHIWRRVVVGRGIERGCACRVQCREGYVHWWRLLGSRLFLAEVQYLLHGHGESGGGWWCREEESKDHSRATATVKESGSLRVRLGIGGVKKVRGGRVASGGKKGEEGREKKRSFGSEARPSFDVSVAATRILFAPPSHGHPSHPVPSGPHPTGCTFMLWTLRNLCNGLCISLSQGGSERRLVVPGACRAAPITLMQKE